MEEKENINIEKEKTKRESKRGTGQDVTMCGINKSSQGEDLKTIGGSLQGSRQNKK